MSRLVKRLVVGLCLMVGFLFGFGLKAKEGAGAAHVESGKHSKSETKQVEPSSEIAQRALGQQILAPPTSLKSPSNPPIKLSQDKAESSQDQIKKWSWYYPYTPEVKEYTLELGAMWEKQNLYWVGGSFGYHLGRCIFSESQTCQQYMDIIGGAGGREGQTHGIVLGALRWQFVSFPAPISPSVRLLAGIMNIRDDERDFNAFSYGLSYALTASVQKGFDLRLEYRIGGGDRIWSQTLLSMSLKIDRWVDYFGGKLKKIGLGAVNVTGTVLDQTISAPKKMIHWIKDPEQENATGKKPPKAPNKK